jgi:hypothetical protein
MEPREVVTLNRIGSGHYVIGGRSPAELRLARWRYRAEAFVGGQRYELRRIGILDRGSSVRGADGAEVLCLSRRHPNVPGLADVDWRIRARWRGYEARLTSPGAVELTVRTGHGGRSDVTAEIAGTLPNRDLVLVAAAFAVLLRRREDTDAAAGAAASTAAVG